MRPEPVTVVQAQPDMPPGLLAAWARVRGVELDVRRVDRGDPLPGSPAAIAILGADVSIGDRSVAWLENLREWTADAIDAGVPVLGIAFGAQLVAALLGAAVEPAPVAETGWVRVQSDEPWLPAGPWLSWHRDVIVDADALDVRARNAHGVQAFTAGDEGRHLGVQFRPEATTATIASWAVRAGLGRLEDRAALDTQTAQHSAAATARARVLFDHWAHRAGVLAAAERVAVAA